MPGPMRRRQTSRRVLRPHAGVRAPRLEIDLVFFGFLQVGFAALDVDVLFGPFLTRIFRQVDFLSGRWFVGSAHSSIRIQLEGAG